MKLGVVGLPNVGKSTLFNAITQAGAQAANYPFCTIEPNIGAVAVPDERLDALAIMHKPEKITPAVIEFVDIAGLVRGAYKGEGLGNRFLSHIREVDAIVHVVRCFEDENIVHVDGSVNPVRDMETINVELIFADLDTVEKRLDRSLKNAKSGDKKFRDEATLLKRMKQCLEAGLPVRSLELDASESDIAREMFLLTMKPVIYVANISEGEIRIKTSAVESLFAQAEKEGAEAMTICARVEEEITELDPEEKAQFIEELGIGESGLDKLVKACYRLLGLISFLTAGPKEVRAWTIVKGTRAPQAAGKIHSDFERGFIRAETIHYDTLMQHGSMQACRERGLIRSEGKEYVIRDGDIVLFRFNV